MGPNYTEPNDELNLRSHVDANQVASPLVYRR